MVDRHAAIDLQRAARLSFGAIVFAALLLSVSPAQAQICDPVGSPPHFGCSWSTDQCIWVCPICDPLGLPPRSGCNWDLNLCNWVCPGYTGVRVTVQTTQPPNARATVYVQLRSRCTTTGVNASCSGSFDTKSNMTRAEKCQALEGVVTQQCGSAGYAVSADACDTNASFEVANVGCPVTPFAFGVSNDSSVFDQSGNGQLPDGEKESISGSSASCATTPGPVSNLLMTEVDPGTLRLNWDEDAYADDYIVYSDISPSGTFDNVVGTATTGADGLILPMPSASEYYLVAGRNQSCGRGPKN
jgi:hypothetical protein